MSSTPQTGATSDDPHLRFDPDAVVRSIRVEIDAPAQVVWTVLTDLPRYGDWNPFCISAESTLELGAPVKMQLKSYLEPGVILPNIEFVCAVEPIRLLSWQMPWTEAWPYPARRDQIVTATDVGRCTYESTDAFLGENGIHVMRFAGPWIKRAFDDTAHALKARAEHLHQSR